MHNPCRKCIVRASCTKICRESEEFTDKAATVVTFFAFLIAGIILTTFLLYMNSLMEQGYEWPQMVLVITWIISFMFCNIWQAPMKKKQRISFWGIIIFGPFLSICLLIFMITKSYCQTACNVKKGGEIF
jgi:hypothetical protein